MNKITTTVIFVLLILNLSSAPGLFSAENRQKFKITARAEVQEISLNRNFRVIIEISYLGKPGDYNITDPQLEMYHNLVTTGSSSETEVEAPSGQDQGQEVHKRYIFNLKGESLGQAYFPRAHISVNDPKGILLNELTTQPIPITVIEPIKKRDYTPLIIVTLVLGLFTPAVFYIVKQLKKLKEKREEKERAEEEKLKNKNIHEDHFFSELKKIEKKNTAEKLSEAIHLLKDYFEKKFNGHFKDKSSKEILDHFLKNNLIEKNLIEQLQNILNESDVLKFSSGDPDPKKAEQLLKNIKGIVYSILGRKSK